MSIAKQEKLNNKVITGEGLWNIYKPKGVSSFDVVRDIKRMMGEKKVGYAGTLDPLAEGVLIVGVGREATKQLRFVLEEDKEYIGEVKLGMVSTTDDEEGEKSKLKIKNSKLKIASTSPFAKGGVNERTNTGKRGASKIFEAIPLLERSESEVRLLKILRNEEDDKKEDDTIWPTLEEIEKVIKENFIGDIVQRTPSYSAVKIGGERAYKKARRGEKFTRPPRIVTIKEIEILDYFVPMMANKTKLTCPPGSSEQVNTAHQQNNSASQQDSDSEASSPAFSERANSEQVNDYPILKIRAIVSSGTYIRSLAREIGEKLGTGGYLISLIRTRIGKYKIEDSAKLLVNVNVSIKSDKSTKLT